MNQISRSLSQTPPPKLTIFLVHFSFNQQTFLHICFRPIPTYWTYFHGKKYTYHQLLMVHTTCSWAEPNLSFLSLLLIIDFFLLVASQANQFGPGVSILFYETLWRNISRSAAFLIKRSSLGEVIRRLPFFFEGRIFPVSLKSFITLPTTLFDSFRWSAIFRIEWFESLVKFENGFILLVFLIEKAAATTIKCLFFTDVFRTTGKTYCTVHNHFIAFFCPTVWPR